ncbi:MAG: tRNA glutamyl-Q(34) synthetase GluQRS [Bacteroidales bacterium]|nr:tRNA glutamyl-Q(34) synthetase GluQRS [Bacteroidales bacterium]
MKGRFAPSPTGRMHLGNVYSALLSWLSVRSQGGTWVLRIEDLDPQRSHRIYAEQIEDDLHWLGLDWDEGGLENMPANPSSQQGSVSYIQSERGTIYTHYLNKLKEKGLTYPCYCTRADIMATQAPHEADGRVVYAGTCRPKNLDQAWSNVDSHPSGRKPATRIIVPDEEISFVDAHYGPLSVNLARHCGDFVLRRADGAWAYQLAVVVDDALMGITEVVRGRDLLLSAPQQIYLYRLLGFEVPTFCHLPLLCNETGQRLCKRDKSLDMGEIRRSGRSPESVLGQLAFYAGIIDRPEPVSALELVPEFSWTKVPVEDIYVSK